jgi:phosphoribosylformylglycinamidine synthase
MNVAILQFPGTNCELDTKFAFNKLGTKNTIVWHTEKEIPRDTDLIVIAGGFSYGDYLRSGAIAAKSPIMQAVIAYANAGGKVLGICNGFQILLESGLLPGAMKRNEQLHFISRFQHLKVINNTNDFLSKLQKDDLVNIPLAHAEGNYFVDAETLESMYDNKQVILKYANANGELTNVNGSIDNIAGICNLNKNVFGLMPHPERAVDTTTQATDGLKMLEGFLA